MIESQYLTTKKICAIKICVHMAGLGWERFNFSIRMKETLEIWKLACAGYSMEFFHMKKFFM